MQEINQILSRAVNPEYFLSAKEAEILFSAKSKEELSALKQTADAVRKEISGDEVSYIVNLNANFTNICESMCYFCAFRKSENDSDSYVLDVDEFDQTLHDAVKKGITEVCFQGGLYTKLRFKGINSKSLLDTYGKLLLRVKETYPQIHIHAYSPEEIEFLSVMSGKDARYILEYLKDCGLDSMPGTAAEILSDDIRALICPKKIKTKKWVEIISLAHRLNIPSTATIMYGHFETDFHKAKHLEILRNIQRETGGFTEFVPLPFVADKTLISKQIVPLTPQDRLKMLAVARIFFKNLIPNIQASWVKQGDAETAEALDWGVNDIGGTLGDERITHAAGGNFGKGKEKEELIEIIKSKGRIPVQRDTLYKPIKDPALV